MREVVLVSSVRTPVGRANKGTLRATRPDELAAVAIKGALDRVPQLDPNEIEDVILGCAMPEAEQGMNVARIASLRAGLPEQISAMTINPFCSSGLQSIAMAAERFPITREEADNFSLRSHQKALAAIAAGNFADETVAVPVSFTTPNGSKPKRTEIIFKTDEGPRSDTTLEALAALRPAFHVKGTVTAGNSSQMSDGAAAAVVMSAERARLLGIQPLARYVAFATAGYKPE